MSYRATALVVTGLVMLAALGSSLAAMEGRTSFRPAAAATATQCRTNQTSVEFVRSGVAAGNVLEEFGFKNDSLHECRMKGFPKVQMLSASGGSVSTTQRDSGLFAAIRRSKTVVLRHRWMAYFALYYPDSTGFDDLHCPTSAALELTPPGETHAIVFHGQGSQIEPYGGNVVHLHCGEIDVSPVTTHPF